MRREVHGSRNGPGSGRLLAGAPISWGVCELPGWGRQLEPERVLAEMASLGLAATELGPVGYLPLDADRVRSLLDRFDLRLVAGFVPLVLHERSPDTADVLLAGVAPLLAALGGEVVTVAPVMDSGWSPPERLTDPEWAILAENLTRVQELVQGHGLALALHPHAGSLVETRDQIERVLGESDVPVCLDTGHLAIGGADPVEFVRRYAERITHVHLKDVDAALAEQVGAGALSLVDATRRGLFRPLGRGDASIGEVVDLLDRHGYERWLVLEQDTTITGEEPPVGRGPVLDVQVSIEYLASLAPANGGGTQHR
ncbi:MAG TPA: TIM barrel protein [Thermoleophilaceae bacterium]|nr:TIM barrel protein [Thermoleophilaceae bacterium]